MNTASPITISAAEVESACSLEEVVESQRKAFAGLISGTSVMGPRAVITNGENAQFSYIARASSTAPTIVKFGSVTGSNSAKGLPVVQAYIAVMDSETGSLTYFVDGESVTRIRTTAASMVAAQELANKPNYITVIGSAPQAIAHAKAALELFKPTKLAIVVRSADKGQFVKAQFADNLPVEISQDVEAAVATADLIFTCTNSMSPLFKGKLKPGTTCIAIGSFAPNREEIATEVVVAADKVFADDSATTQLQCGSIIPALKSQARKWAQVVSIGEVINRSVNGRENPAEVICYFSVGLGIQDAAFVELLMQKRAGK